MIKKIYDEDILIALIIPSHYSIKEGIEFLTPDNFSQQLGFMNRPVGYKIPPHVHNPVVREVIWTQEVLFIKSGKVRVDFYDKNKNYLESVILVKGDVILLAGGGHGFEMLEKSEMIEVKQGPYCADKDKTRFEPVNKEMVRYNK
jgi:hypothetical protein